MGSLQVALLEHAREQLSDRLRSTSCCDTTVRSQKSFLPGRWILVHRSHDATDSFLQEMCVPVCSYVCSYLGPSSQGSVSAQTVKVGATMLVLEVITYLAPLCAHRHKVGERG